MDDAGAKATRVAMLVLAVFLLCLYQTRIRASVRSIGNTVKFAIALLFANTVTRSLFLEAMPRYSGTKAT